MLALSKADVTLIERSLPLVKAIKERGLRLEGASGEVHAKVPILMSPPSVGEKFDLVILAVKAYDTKRATMDVAPVVAERGILLCLQNGIGVEYEARDTLGRNAVLRGVTNYGALLKEPGVVVNTGKGETFVGAMDERLSDKARMVSEVLTNAGLSTGVADDIRKVVWQKTLVNAGINPLGALTGLRNGDLVSMEDLRGLMVDTVSEGSRVAKKLGLNFDEDPIEHTLKVAEATAKNKNSMLQDVEVGRRTEIDYMNGAIWKVGSEIGVPTPMNRMLTVLVKGLETHFKA